MILDFEVEDVDAERARLSNIVGEFVLDPTTQGQSRHAVPRSDSNLINMFAVPRAAEKA